MSPDAKESDLLNHYFFAVNQAWNFALSLKIKDLKDNSSLPEADRKYKKFKDIYSLVKEHLQERKIKYNSGVVQDELRKLEDTFKKFHSKQCGFPKFKDSSQTQQSIIVRNQATSWEDGKLKIFRKKIKTKFHRNQPEESKFTGGIVKRESDGKFYFIANFTIEDETSYPKSGIECALDLNVENIAISCTSGTRRLIRLEDFSKSKYSKNFKKLQQKLSKRYKEKNFSKNTKKLQKKSNRIYKKIKNKKEDFFHKLSHELTNQYDRITIEDLNIKKMKESKSTRLNRLISDISWGSLIQKIKYKQEQKNKLIREINPAFSSQRCFKCGFISKNNRKSQSDFKCENCKYTENADLNASDNLLDYDNWSLEQTTLISTWNQNLCS